LEPQLELSEGRASLNHESMLHRLNLY